MKTKILFVLLLSILLLVGIGLGVVYVRPAYQANLRRVHERKLLKESLNHLDRLKKAVEIYIQQRHGTLPETHILLSEIVKLADMNFSKGEWDELGCYTTEHFMYMGGCYSTWCYVEANRKDSSYTLSVQHDGKKWSKKRCSTQMTDLGRMICRHLEKYDWEYIEGEI